MYHYPAGTGADEIFIGLVTPSGSSIFRSIIQEKEQLF